jgi:hypothetical protein
MKLNKKLIAIGMLATVFLAGCQQAPEDSAVKQKNFDKMIEQAQDTEDYDAPESMKEKYDTYKNTFSNDKLGVTVKADAKVQIPQAKQMSVFRVKQKKLDQNFLDKVKKALNINETLYDGYVTEMQTKSDIEKSIQEIKKEIAGLSKDDADYTVIKSEYEDSLKELEEKYNDAPKTLDWSKYVSSGKLESVKSLYEKDESNEFYSWEYELNKDGDVYYGATDGKDGEQSLLYMQNNENYGNCFRYYRGKNGSDVPIKRVYVSAYDSSLLRWSADSEPTENELDGIVNSTDELIECEDEPTTITKDQAKEQVEKFLKDVGLTDYKCSESGLYCMSTGTKDNIKYGYRKVWSFKYLRSIDEILVDNGVGSTHTEGWQGSDYVKKDWPGESLEFCVNDSGIVMFNYNVPLENTETVVKTAKIKNFDDVKSIFEKMVVTTNAQDQGEEEKEEVTLTVDKVVLRYMRINEKDTFDTGLLVPVWDFLGKKEYKILSDENSTEDESLLTINAIDGTVIDRTLGY